MKHIKHIMAIVNQAGNQLLVPSMAKKTSVPRLYHLSRRDPQAPTSILLPTCDGNGQQILPRDRKSISLHPKRNHHTDGQHPLLPITTLKNLHQLLLLKSPMYPIMRPTNSRESPLFCLANPMTSPISFSEAPGICPTLVKLGVLNSMKTISIAGGGK